jgi:stage V sporulation protein S
MSNPATDQKPPTFYVSKDSNPGNMGGMVAHTLRERDQNGLSMACCLQAIGAAAVNQAVKACIIAMGKLEESHHHAIWVPSFTDEMIGGTKKTAIRFRIYVDNRPPEPRHV